MGLKATLKYISHLNVVNREIGKFVDRAVSRSILVMERNVKLNTPVKEGHLKRSINSRKTGYGQGEVYNAAVEGGKEINYAVHVEYGTRHMAPRAMFRKGVADSEPRIKEIFKEEARKVHDKASGN